MDQGKSSFRWMVLTLLFASLLIATLSMNCIPPLFKEIMPEIPLTKTQMGTVMGVLAPQVSSSDGDDAGGDSVFKLSWCNFPGAGTGAGVKTP